MLNYLVRTTRSEIVIAVHQCIRCTESLKLPNKKTIERIMKYLIGTNHVGMHVVIEQ